jgi:hypothetical protein
VAGAAWAQFRRPPGFWAARGKFSPVAVLDQQNQRRNPLRLRLFYFTWYRSGDLSKTLDFPDSQVFTAIHLSH